MLRRGLWGMDTETRTEIIEHALRWATNMVVEVASNHSHVLPEDARRSLRDASRALQQACADIRTSRL